MSSTFGGEGLEILLWHAMHPQWRIPLSYKTLNTLTSSWLIDLENTWAEPLLPSIHSSSGCECCTKRFSMKKGQGVSCASRRWPSSPLVMLLKFLTFLCHITSCKGSEDFSLHVKDKRVISVPQDQTPFLKLYTKIFLPHFIHSNVKFKFDTQHAHKRTHKSTTQ